MKYTFVISQVGVVEQGLLGVVSLPELCLLDYLAGWFFCKKAERVTLDDREFRWVDYGHAIDELPLLFNPDAGIRSRKNALCLMVRRLRAAKLVETESVGKRLYFRLTDTAADLGRNSQQIVTNSPPVVTPGHDDIVTPKHDPSFTSKRDDTASLIIDETCTIEEGIREEGKPLLLPVDAFVDEWNSKPKLPQIVRMTAKRKARLIARSVDRFFERHWRAGIERIATSPFCTGQNDRNWRASVEWFLREDTLEKVIEGQFDGPTATRSPSPVPNRSMTTDTLRAAIV